MEKIRDNLVGLTEEEHEDWNRGYKVSNTFKEKPRKESTMEKLSDYAISLCNGEVFNKCDYSSYSYIHEALCLLKEYEELGLTPEKLKEKLAK